MSHLEPTHLIAVQRARSFCAFAGVFAVCSTFSSAAIAATASPPALRNGFSPHPFETSVDIKNDNVSMYDRGFAKCGSSTTTKEPAFTFTLGEAMTDLRLSVDVPAVLVGPDKAFSCLRGNPVSYGDWPAGTWQVFLFSGTDRLSAHIRLDQPNRTTTEAASTASKAPPLALPTQKTPNPEFVDVVVGARFDNGSAGVTCASAAFEAKQESLAPLASLTLTKKQTRLEVKADKAGVVLVDDKGRCLADIDRVALAPGHYTLWALWAKTPSSTPKTLSLVIEDVDLPTRFAASPLTIALGDAKKAQVFAATSANALRVETMCEGGTPRAPSFVVDADAENVVLSAFREAGTVHFDILELGDEEGAALDDGADEDGDDDDVHEAKALRPKLRCDVSGDVTFRKMRGRFAIFAKTKKPAQALLVLSRRADVDADLFFLPFPVPEQLSIVDRGLERHYPLLTTLHWTSTLEGKRIHENMERFFLEAPRQLFVTVKADRDGLIKGEPLLIRDGSKAGVTVHRADGSRHDVLVKDLADLPQPTTLPAYEKPQPATDVHEAIISAGVAEDAYVNAFDAVERAFNVCVGTWMEKNDPTWGKSYDLVYSNGDTMSDRKFRQADGVCGRKKLDAAANKMIAQVNASRVKGAAAYRKALEQRFTR